MKETYEHFGKWVRRWREEKGLTQQQLADLTGKTKSYVSNIERNQPHGVTGALPRSSIEVVDKLAKALNRPAAEAREAAGYGLRGSRAAAMASPSPSNDADPAASLEEVLIYYFRLIPLERRPDALAIMARFYQESMAAAERHAIEESEIGNAIEILGRLGQG